MNTLDTPRVSAVLDELFEASAATKARFVEDLGRLSREDRASMVASSDPLTLYRRAEHVHLAIPRSTGTLLYMLARATRAQAMVEFGSSFGLSTLFLAAALRDNGGGRLISSEFVASKVVRARDNLAKAGLADLVEVRPGDAMESLAHDLPDALDFVFLDGAKQQYGPLLDMLEPRLRPGAVLVADNVGGSPEYLSKVRASARYASTPIGGDLEWSVRL